MTKSTWSEKDQRLVPEAQSKTGHDHLLLPGGRRPIDLSTADLTRTLQAAGIPGVSASYGRDANMALYAKHIQTMHQRAGDQVVTEWIKAHK